MLKHTEEVYALYFTHGEYDDYVKITFGCCKDKLKAISIITELNDYAEFFNLGERMESKLGDYLYKEFGLGHDVRFDWEILPVLEFNI